MSLQTRVAVTGVGVVSPIGIGREEFWRSAVAARSGIDSIRRFDATSLPTRIAGEVAPERVDPLPFLRNRKATKTMTPNAIFALVAAGEAALQAGFSPERHEPDRVSVLIGSEVKQWTFNEVASFYLASRCRARERREDHWQHFCQLAGEHLNPFSFLKNMPNMDAAHISIAFDARGPSSTITTGSTGGMLAIGEAFFLIRRGEADVAFAGGTNAFATPMEIVHHAVLGCLSRRNDDPASAVRSFDVSRDGVALGEGAAVVMLENLESAKRRGAKVLAEVRGFASRLAPPRGAGDGNGGGPGEGSFGAALRAAAAPPEAIDVIHAFGMATPSHDRWETRSIREAAGAAAATVPVTSIRPLVGLCGAASSALDVVAAVLMLEHGEIPPVANLRSPDPECALSYVRGDPLRAAVQLAALHALDLDGHGATLILSAGAQGAP